MHPLVVLATGYAGLLLAVAAGLERLARHTAVRSHRYRTTGFTYQPDHDLWMCPRNEPLWPYEVDRQHRLVRYRARPAVCNACPVKADCTSSSSGREIVRPIDPWPHSEAGRFHRGVSVTLTAIAGAFVVAVAIPHHQPVDFVVILPSAALTGWLMWHWGRDFLRTPSGFPDTSMPPSQQRTRISWGFDRQASGGRYRSTRRDQPSTDQPPTDREEDVS